MKTGWIWIRTNALVINHMDWYFSFGFENDRLMIVSIGFYEKKEGESSSWDDWTREEEENNARRFNLWLDEELGLDRNFDWGDVYAAYNEKSAFSSIEIKYKKS